MTKLMLYDLANTHGAVRIVELQKAGGKQRGSQETGLVSGLMAAADSGDVRRLWLSSADTGQ